MELSEANLTEFDAPISVHPFSEPISQTVYYKIFELSVIPS